MVQLKIRIPRFMTLRRRYEVNESMWLVKFGRPKVDWLVQVGRPFAIHLVKEGQRAAFLAIGWGRAGISDVKARGRMILIFFQWRRRPKDWELSFVRKMKLMEALGIQFPDVLHTYLPSVMGEAPADVLLRWVGKKTRLQPKRFTNAAAKMFGTSSKPIITGLEKLADPEKMYHTLLPVEPPYQSLVDAIRAADDESKNTKI